MKNYNDTNKKRDSNRTWMATNRAAYPEKSRLYQAQMNSKYVANGQKRRNRLLTDYGLTQSQVDQMLAACNYTCVICKEPFKALTGKSGPHIDHIHGTKIVRGLLHGRCNTALGSLRDDPVVMRRAIRYIETQGKETEDAELELYEGTI